MCGIGGILGGEFRADERESSALCLQAALRHRGPDDEGVFLHADAALVHTRLAIIDPTPGGRQPMTRGPLTLTFNGEIYNFRELREELVRAGEKFTSATDTEVLLALYARHGPLCLKMLRGMFAFAIWDERDRSCFLARDPFGIKPLYHASISDGGLVFASELRALLATGLVPRRIDAAGLDGYLATGSVPEPRTMVEGVACLRAGHWLRWQRGKIMTDSYATIGFGSEAATSKTPMDVCAALDDAMEHHLVSDVSVGLLLSGGLDSSALLALTQRRGHRELMTFSLGVEDPGLDESEAARALARHFGVEHHEMLLTQELARHWIDDFLDSIDQPTLDGFNIYCACKLANDHGCKVVLSGLGADELFGGYPSFRQVPALHRAGRMMSPIAPALRGLERLGPGARSRRTCDYLGGEASLSRAYAAFRGVFTPREIASLRHHLLPGLAPVSRPDQREEAEECDSITDVGDAISHLELTRYLRNQLLRDADVMSMAYGVELRVPLLDLPLFAALRAVPAARRLAPGKRLLRESVPELPIELLATRKRGFSLPFQSWLMNEWSDLSHDLPPFPDAPLSPWYRKWALVVLTRWLRKHELIPG
jgi:asparagine synthase (glutamine-hydrolysing)